MDDYEEKYSFAFKWSEDIAPIGFTQVPNCLLTCQSELGITSTELNVMLQILRYKYDDRAPFPALSTVASHIGISVGAVRRNLRSLENKGLIRRFYRRSNTNLFDFNPLIKRLDAHKCTRVGHNVPPTLENIDGSPRPHITAKEYELQQDELQEYPPKKTSDIPDFSSMRFPEPDEPINLDDIDF